MNRKLLLRVVLALLTLTLLVPVFAAGKKKQDWSGEKLTDKGRVDWKKGVIYATGLGAMDNRISNQAKAYLRAREYAKYDAIANLLMAVDHVRIDTRTVGKDFEADTEIKAEISGIVRGAEVISERKIPVGGSTMVEVTVATPLYGERSIASVFIPEVVRRNGGDQDDGNRSAKVDDDPQPDPDPQPEEEIKPLPILPRVKITPVRPKAPLPALRGPRDDDPITSVIIDTRGMGIDRSMCPKIRRPDGSEVWGTVRANPDFVIEHGIVVYAHSLGEAQKDGRAGNNPLILRAVGRAAERFSTDAVISREDAERLMEANSQSGFLNKYRVIFVVDANK